MADREDSKKVQERLLRSDRENRYLRKDSDQRKSMEEVFDRATLLAVEELVSRRELSDLFGVVNSGKEARVYSGVDAKGKSVAVKIYLTTTAGFKKRMGYIAGDRRFGKLPSSSREVIYLWVRKEFKNLQLADSAGVRVPKPLTFHKNILIMEYVGDPPDPAPTFAETEVDGDNYDWTFEMIKALRSKGMLVHGDLSEFNVFKTAKERILFDMGSAVLTTHPHADEYLRRDVSNMVRFFKKRGIFVKDVDFWMEEIMVS